MVHSRQLPRVGVYVIFIFSVGGDLVMPVWMPWRAHDAGVVAAVGEHEGHTDRLRHPPHDPAQVHDHARSAVATIRVCRRTARTAETTGIIATHVTGDYDDVS